MMDDHIYFVKKRVEQTESR